MKKTRITWSLINLTHGSSAEIVKLQTVWAGFSAAIASSTFALSTPNMTLLIALLCMVVDKIVIGGLNIEEENVNKPE